MSTITTEQVKELREASGVSVMQCRKALEEAGGDMEKAKIILQKKGAEVAQKKADRDAADGVVVTKTDGTRAVVLSLRCETDFVAKNEDFTTLAAKLLEIAWNEGADAVRAQAAGLIEGIVLKIGENIKLGNIEEISGEAVGVYAHHTGKVAAAVILSGGNAEVAKDIAMHVAAMKPIYLTSDEIDEAARAGVIEVLKKEVDESDKPEDIKAKMLEGKIQSYFKEQTLNDQAFFKAPEKTIAQYAKEHGATVAKFMIYTV